MNNIQNIFSFFYRKHFFLEMFDSATSDLSYVVRTNLIWKCLFQYVHLFACQAKH